MLVFNYSFKLNGEKPKEDATGEATCDGCGDPLVGRDYAELRFNGSSERSRICLDCYTVLAAAADILGDVKREHKRKEGKNDVSL